MEIKVGSTWTRAEAGWRDGRGFVWLKDMREVRIVAVETCFVCVEEITLPAHPEYGHPRKWVPRGAFLGDIVLTGGST